MIRMSRMPGEHQRGQRVVDHRLVVDRQQLLAHGLGQRMQARARAAGQDDALHAVSCRGRTALDAAELGPGADTQAVHHRVAFVIGEPFTVPRDTDDDALEASDCSLERELATAERVPRAACIATGRQG
jgi:hypothetical protein